MANAQVEILIDFIKSLRVNAFGEMGVLLSPVLEDGSEARTDAASLLHEIIALLVKEKLEAVSDEHEVKDEVLVLRLVAGDADHITNLLRILSDQAIADVPVGLSDHVCEENALYLVQKKDLGHGFDDLVDGEFESYGAAAGY